MLVESAAISRRTRTAKLCGQREDARQTLLENAHILEVWRGLFPDSDLERIRSEGFLYRALIKGGWREHPPVGAGWDGARHPYLPGRTAPGK